MSQATGIRIVRGIWKLFQSPALNLVEPRLTEMGCIVLCRSSLFEASEVLAGACYVTGGLLPAAKQIQNTWLSLERTRLPFSPPAFSPEVPMYRRCSLWCCPHQLQHQAAQAQLLWMHCVPRSFGTSRVRGALPPGWMFCGAT